MDSQTNPSSIVGLLVAYIRDMFGERGFLMVLAGILAGVSIGILGNGVITVPLLGSVPATLVGTVGLAGALITCQQWSCCDENGEGGCECTEGCGDSCSYDP
ncbi:hypothetical protein C479_07328 [Halovivax asiaticus JCM 14624]|uniref:Uncharacterized protein n=1 Tax=Halovivax asiaticus JCM 14624 TaxID=1227490 RepID=M0BJN7_9EURY|nr:hypothetical protein [Halovivax asiaticus]ELZ11101.1 hypothetical protein C479_07328 [Halovivax asiaticus JCM 14624]